MSVPFCSVLEYRFESLRAHAVLFVLHSYPMDWGIVEVDPDSRQCETVGRTESEIDSKKHTSPHCDSELVSEREKLNR